MAKKCVLAIGIDPALVDFTALPQLTPELIRNYIDAQIERLRALGYDVDSCLVDLGETAEAVAAEALRSKHFDCVVIGAGLREPPQRLHLLQHHARRHRRGRAALGRALSPRVPVCPGIVKFTLAGFEIASLIGT